MASAVDDGQIRISFSDKREQQEELLESTDVVKEEEMGDNNNYKLDHYEHRAQCTYVFVSSILFLLIELAFTILCGILWGVVMAESNVQAPMWALDFFFGLFGIAVASIGIAASAIITPWKRQIFLGYAYVVMLVIKCVMRLIVCIYAIVILSNLFYVFVIFAVIAIGLYISFIFFTVRRIRTIKSEMLPIAKVVVGN